MCTVHILIDIVKALYHRVYDTIKHGILANQRMYSMQSTTVKFDIFACTNNDLQSICHVTAAMKRI